MAGVREVDGWLEGDSIETYPTGHFYNFEKPDPATIKLEDIAHALSQICRFGGFTSQFHSVASHSLLVADICRATDPDHELGGFMHDFHETYLGDRPSPMKPSIPEFRRLTNLADDAIGEAFSIDPQVFHTRPVKKADALALFHEARIFLPSGGPDIPLEELPDGCFVYDDVSPGLMRANFIERAEKLLEVKVG